MALKAPNEPNLSETEAEEGTDSNDAETNPDEIKYPKVAKVKLSLFIKKSCITINKLFKIIVQIILLLMSINSLCFLDIC